MTGDSWSKRKPFYWVKQYSSTRSEFAALHRKRVGDLAFSDSSGHNVAVMQQPQMLKRIWANIMVEGKRMFRLSLGKALLFFAGLALLLFVSTLELPYRQAVRSARPHSSLKELRS